MIAGQPSRHLLYHFVMGSTALGTVWRRSWWGKLHGRLAREPAAKPMVAGGVPQKPPEPTAFRPSFPQPEPPISREEHHQSAMMPSSAITAWTPAATTRGEAHRDGAVESQEPGISRKPIDQALNPLRGSRRLRNDEDYQALHRHAWLPRATSSGLLRSRRNGRNLTPSAAAAHPRPSRDRGRQSTRRRAGS